MKKELIRFDVAPQTYALLLRLRAVGLWGETADEVALQCMYRGLQEAHSGGFLDAPRVSRAPGNTPVPEFETEPEPAWQDRTGWRWCEQCERRVAPSIAKRCKSPFCKAKPGEADAAHG